jgi:hypothetical protein
VRSNLDGGGSTALVVQGALANVPSDSTGERPIGNVIAVTRRQAGAPPPSCVLPLRPRRDEVEPLQAPNLMEEERSAEGSVHRVPDG